MTTTADVSFTCACGAPSGFTNLGNPDSYQWWVHAACGRPTEPWLRAQGEDVLNFFRGGPLDGAAYSTSQLLTAKVPEQTSWVLQLQEYRWTHEVIVSQKTGASARVWCHETVPRSETEVVVPTAAAGPSSAAPPQEGADMAAKKKAEAAPASDNLEERRKAGKFSRNQVAEKSGLTVGAVYRVEKGTSSKTTDDEVAQYVSGLQALESENAS